MRRTGIKICGVTRVEDARLAVELGAQFIGINFWSGSPRCVSMDRAAAIVDAIRGRTTVVGVWVDPEPGEVAAGAAALGLDLLQFHGDESPTDLEVFAGRAIKAFRVGSDFRPRCLESFHNAWGFLFDCGGGGAYGGTGIAWPYERIADLETSKPVFLAGGLRPENVADAIERSRADYVDVCSGVEASPGVKDHELLRRFFREVHDVRDSI